MHFRGKRPSPRIHSPGAHIDGSSRVRQLPPSASLGNRARDFGSCLPGSSLRKRGPPLHAALTLP